MKRTALISAILMIFSAGVFATEGKAPAAKKAHDCANCPMHRKAGARKCSGKMCPEKIAGVTTVSKNIENGVEITMTAKDKETAAKVQELTLVHYGNKETMDKDCPGRVEGAESRIENTADGVKVLLTAKTPDTVKKIQAASAREHGAAAAAKPAARKEAKAAKKYTCAMKCAVSDKPGKCPKCGMPMEEIK